MTVSFRDKTIWLQQMGGSCQTTAPVAVAMCKRAIKGAPFVMLSQQYTWDRAMALDRARGLTRLSAPTPPSVQKTMREDGICAQTFYGIAGANADAATHKVVIEEITGDYIANGIAALNRGDPLVGNGFITAKWYPPYTGGVIPMAISTSEFDGGHDWQVIGWSDEKQAWECCNGWPAYGFFWLARDYFAPLPGYTSAWNGFWVIRDVDVGYSFPPVQPQGNTVTYDEIIAALQARTWTQAQVDAFRAAAQLAPVTPSTGTVIGSKVTAPDGSVFSLDGASVNRNRDRVGVPGRYIIALASDGQGIKAQEAHTGQWFLYPGWTPTSAPI